MPIENYFNLMVRLVPDVRTVGIIYTSSEVNSVVQAERAIEVAHAMGLETVVATVTSTNDVAQVTESIINRVCAIYLPSDNVLASAYALVIQIAHRNMVPVFPSTEEAVRDGCLASVALNYYNLGRQTAVMAVKILNGEAEPQTMPIEYLEVTSIFINMTAARELGIEIPEDILAAATLVD
jgi:putative ABC transport system substrate-binding protein